MPGTMAAEPLDPGPSPLAPGDQQMRVDAARAAIAAALVPIAGDETVPLEQALGRVLARDVVSPIDVPAHDNAAMDGYAFDGAALAPGGDTVLAVRGTVFAGQPWAGGIDAGEALRIMTGAVMPEGCDTVVPHELCDVERAAGGAGGGDAAAGAADRVRIAAGVLRAGDNRRCRGEDLAAGRPALTAGRLLRPADIGLAASLGLAQLPVKRRLRVALFSTGDELRSPGEPLPPGCIFDSNRASLRAALQRLNLDVLDLGLVRDDPALLQATLDDALARGADAVVTSGGVSMGDADHTRDVLARMGEVGFWKVAMRPGRPFAFGPLWPAGATRDTRPPAWLFALPGNPVAALVTFHAFARDALLQLQGATPQPVPLVQARCSAAIRKRPGRTEYQRAVLERGADGGPVVRLTGSQGAGVLRSMSEANALLVLHHDQGSIAAGAWVDVWPFDGLV
jgi:molybdopterin molybdotransferase